MGGEEIICTAEHPFYVVGKGFVPARELNEGDNLISSDGAQVTINSLKIEHLEFPETTYNFEVEDFHTYYVSQIRLQVHNKCEIDKFATDVSVPNSPKLIKDSYLKKNNIDPHLLKYEVLGKKAQISRYDIYLDTTNNFIWLGSKSKPMHWIETFITFGGS